jgi:hypothetical protein
MADELPVARVPDRLGEALGEHLGGVATLRLLEETRDEPDVPELVVEEALPDPPDAGCLRTPGRADGHVVVVGLVLAGHQRVGVKLRQRAACRRS